MGAGASLDSSEPGTKYKVALYQQIKNEWAEASKADSDEAAATILAEKMGCTEELIKAIVTSSTPKKANQVLSESASLPAVLQNIPGADVGDGASAEVADAVQPTPDAAGADDTPSADAPIPPDAIPMSPIPSQCSKIVQTMVQSNYPDFIIGLDGSKSSKLSLEVAIKLRKAKGKIIAFHVEDPAKEDLPSKFSWNTIHSEADTLLCGNIPPSYYKLESTLKSTGENTKQSFNRYIHEQDIPAYVCVGITGRKGPKDDPTILGQVADLAMRSCSQPVIVCKEAVGDERTYIVCVDKTERAMMAYEATIALARPVDSIKVIFCSDVGSSEDIAEMKEKYEGNFKANGLGGNVTFQVVEKEPGTPLHDAITNFVNGEKPSFVVCAPDPQLERVEQLSVSERIVKHCKCNCILYKVPQTPAQ